MVFILTIERHVDYIIVGQGLAGSSLAIQLIQQGKKVVVFDEPVKNQCSRVAAGLFNPITGKGIVKTWMAEELFTSLTHYTHCESVFGRRFFFPQLLYRPFYSAEEQNNWMAKSGDGTVAPFIEKIFTACHFQDQVHDVHGGILLKASGYLDAPSFLAATSQYLDAKDSLEVAHFNALEVIHSLEGIIYQNIRARQIIFCAGVSDNPFFKWLPIRSLKGETLTINLEISPSVIFNRGVYIVPLARTNSYKVGATYQLKDLSQTITLEGRTELMTKLNGLLKNPLEVVGQDWGIRPTTLDRRPMLGPHPSFKNLVIFNGLGTKGVSLAPYFSAQLANWLTGNGEIQKEVHIKRFNALYSSS